ncbi:hypothetical protein FZC84_21645 [Rossellomorea vietnamensis]|uniref:Uncharacterized protein n=1 Tax=Rossellomorea vietnamensis TaxID=218284 RepID=A0A5D4M197_9BACI|nr:hypothetical protein FZC84_21645 [Rossellomorea vietnamensis]
MENLKDIADRLDDEFQIRSFGKDPAFSRFIPQVYQGRVKWKEKFEPEFIGVRIAEDKGVDTYISGEIHCHIDNDYGRKRFEEVKKYANQTEMCLIGVSHSASEYLVKKTLMNSWFQKNFGFDNIYLLPQKRWWL